MKILMAIVEERFKHELETVLAGAGVRGYSEISDVVGVGETGPRLGSGAFPTTSAIVMSILEDGAVEPLATRVREHCRECGQRARLLVLPVEELT